MVIVRSNKLPVKHPGIVFKEKFLSSYSITEVITTLNVSRTELSSFTDGKSSLSVDLAKKLEQLTGVSMKFWMSRQSKYELHINS